MYNPEFELRKEQVLELLRNKAEEASEEFGEDSFAARASNLWLVSIEKLCSLSSDQDNCFDEDARREKKKDILDCLNAITSEIENILKTANKKSSEE